MEEVDRVKSLQSQVDGVKDIMTQNVERILARGERLDDLMDKSEDLQAGVRHPPPQKKKKNNSVKTLNA